MPLPFNMGAARSLVGKLPEAARNVVGKLPGAVRSVASRGLDAARGAVPAGMRQEIGHQVGQMAGMGAALGGSVGAIGGALQADEGHRMEGALSGGAKGAVGGALSGAASGVVTGASRYGRLKYLDKQAPGGAFGMLDTAPMGAEQLNKGYGQTLKDLASGKGALGRKADLFEAVAAPATLAADMYVGDQVMKHLPEGMGGHPAQPAPEQPVQPRKLASDDELVPTLIGTSTGGLAGGTLAEAIMRGVDRLPDVRNVNTQAVHDAPGLLGHLHRDAVLRNKVIPGLGGVLGTVGGYYAITHHNEEKAKRKALEAAQAGNAVGAVPPLPEISAPPRVGAVPPAPV